MKKYSSRIGLVKTKAKAKTGTRPIVKTKSRIKHCERKMTKATKRRTSRFGSDCECSRECDEVEKQLFQVKLQLDNLLEQELTMIRGVSSRLGGNSAAHELLEDSSIYNMIKGSGPDSRAVMQNFLFKAIHHDDDPIDDKKPQGGAGGGGGGGASGSKQNCTSKIEGGFVVGKSPFKIFHKNNNDYMYVSEDNNKGWYKVESIKGKHGKNRYKVVGSIVNDNDFKRAALNDGCSAPDQVGQGGQVSQGDAAGNKKPWARVSITDGRPLPAVDTFDIGPTGPSDGKFRVKKYDKKDNKVYYVDLNDPEKQ